MRDVYWLKAARSLQFANRGLGINLFPRYHHRRKANERLPPATSLNDIAVAGFDAKKKLWTMGSTTNSGIGRTFCGSNSSSGFSTLSGVLQPIPCALQPDLSFDSLYRLCCADAGAWRSDRWFL